MDFIDVFYCFCVFSYTILISLCTYYAIRHYTVYQHVLSHGLTYFDPVHQHQRLLDDLDQFQDNVLDRIDDLHDDLYHHIRQITRHLTNSQLAYDHVLQTLYQTIDHQREVIDNQNDLIRSHICFQRSTTNSATQTEFPEPNTQFVPLSSPSSTDIATNTTSTTVRSIALDRKSVV